ncbi:MAG: universal stress protein [Timaviella obliquedivisa GSE-PSE-MK23-08B]|jgi:nucleotide-binding universal stress UspA family protein|nr:universal stress protein [Timaviella obliquedivisa GSE-PSE-MK23-08B]
MFQRLLVCTDLSDGLHRLRNFVPSLAAGGIKQITFLHVIPILDTREIPRVDEQKVAAARDRLTFSPYEGIDIKVQVEWGKPIAQILSAIKTYQPDLLIVGTPTRSLLTEKLMGSTLMDLCQQVSVPLMILRPQLVGAYTDEELDLRCRHLFRYLLIPYDGTQTADYLLKQVKQKAQNRPKDSLEECLLCWVYQTSGRRDLPKTEFSQASQAKLAEASKELIALDLRVSTEVVEGTAIQEVLVAAQEHNVSAIAISSGSLGKIIEISSPSFAGEILRKSWHPVIYFPPAQG